MNCQTCQTAPAVVRGYCKKCYGEGYRAGTITVKPHAHKRAHTRHGLDRNEGMDSIGYDVTESGCWEWRGAKTWEGYGVYRGRNTHRIMFERVRGPLTKGLVLDHLCRNPPCMNPEHLEEVTHRVNVGRGVGQGVRNGPLTAHQKDQITRMKGIFTAKEASDMFGISTVTVYNIWNKAAK